MRGEGSIERSFFFSGSDPPDRKVGSREDSGEDSGDNSLFSFQGRSLDFMFLCNLNPSSYFWSTF